MWENETEQAEQGSDKKPMAFSLKPPQAPESDGIILVQAALCVAVIFFVLITRAISTPFFQELKEQYSTIMSDGIDLSGQGELIRFINTFVEGIRMQAQEVLKSLDAPKGAGGGEEGTALSFQPTQAPYRISVTPLLPVKGAKSSEFGERINPVTHKKEFHAGTDLAAEKGSKVFAAFTGTVELCGYDKVRGNYIILRHTSNLQTLYQHLDKIYAKQGTQALRGQAIGAVGSTGIVTGPHLHFEIIMDGFAVNPEKALRL